MVTKKDKYLAAAQKFLERGQLDKALAEFGRVVQEDPKDTRTWLRMAEIHAKRGQNEQATEIYRKTADIYSEQGFLQKAVAVWKNILKLSPGYMDGYERLAALFAQLGQMREAAEQMELLVAAHLRAGRTQDAMAAMRRIVEIDPENVVSRIKLAEAASQAGATADAVREFAIAADQLRTQGRTEDYLRVAERLFFHQPDNLPLARELAETYIIRNNARLALPKLQACFKADPRDPGTLSLLARAFEQLGQIPKTVSVLKELAKLCHEQGRTVERNRAIRKAMALDPKDAELAETAEKWGIGSDAPRASSMAMPMKAVAVGRAAPVDAQVTRSVPMPQEEEREDLGEAPRSSAQADIARIMAESEVFIKYGLLERAVEHLRRVLDIDEAYVPARLKRVDVLVDLGRNADAVAELEEAAEKLATTDPEDAAALAKRALVLDPGSIRAQTLLQGMMAAERTPAPAPVKPAPAPAAMKAPPAQKAPAPVQRPVARPTTPVAAPPAARSSNPAPTVSRPSVPVLEPTPVVPMPAAVPGRVAATRPAVGAEPAAQRPTEPRQVKLEAASRRDDHVTAPRPIIASMPVKAVPTVRPYRPEDFGDPFAVEPEGSGRVTAPQATVASNEEAEAAFEAGLEAGAEPSARRPAGVAPVENVEELGSQEIEEALEELSGEIAIESEPIETAEMSLDAAEAAAAGGDDLASLDEIDGPGSAPRPGDATAQTPDLTAEMQQLDFFADQGMWQEALALLDELRRRLPEDLEVAAKRAEIETAAAAAGFVVGTGTGAGAFDVVSTGNSARPRAVVDGEADLATHGDLGIAYKEMGLHDAAIAEFQLLTADPAREVFALTMVGECMEAKGAAIDAVTAYKKALASARITPTETTQLYYCLGTAFELAGDAKEAVYYLERVVKREGAFRDASARLERLRKKLRP